MSTSVPTTVQPGMPHIDHLCDEALSCLNENRTEVAITHLAQAVRVAAHTNPRELDVPRIDWLVKGIIGAGGGFA